MLAARKSEELQENAGKSGESKLADLRFRQLLGAAGWDALPAPVRKRFGKRLSAGQSANYVGHVNECRMSLSGRILAQACRLIGAPLPLERDGGVAAMVSVTEDGKSGGQVWTRMYARKRGFPQVIHSAKRFAGPTGLEEYLGRGIGIALNVSAVPGGIRFSSDHYCIAIGPMRLRLPALIAPGQLHIDHIERGDGEFTFTLSLNHALLGEVIHQECRFCDQAEDRPAHPLSLLQESAA
ncbi:MAG: DUF4166 domain-containing protein [Pseudomonadota bacterium]